MNEIDEQQKKVDKEIRQLEKLGGTVTSQAKQLRDSTFARFPVLFVLLSTFGLVATLYGFEKVIDKIDFFANNPAMILIVGLATLILTGTLFKKLK